MRSKFHRRDKVFGDQQIGRRSNDDGAYAGHGAEFASSAMAPGGEANLEAMVKQMMATNPAEAVQKTGKPCWPSGGAKEGAGGHLDGQGK